MTAFIILLVCCDAVLFDAAPFGLAVFVPLCFILNPFVISAFYVCASYLCAPVFTTLYSCSAAVAVAVTAALLAKKFSFFNRTAVKRMTAVVSAGFALTVQWFFISPMTVFLWAFFSAIFYYFAEIFCNTVFVKSLKFKISRPEEVSLGALLVVTGIGMYPLKLYGFEFFYSAGFFIMMAAVYTGRIKAAMPAALCYGLGLSIQGNYMLIAMFSFVALIMCVFASAPRVLCAFSGLMAYCMFGFFFALDAYYILWALCAMTAGAVFFVIIPRPWVKYLADYFDYENGGRIIMRHIVNRSRFDEGNYILSASAVFEEMSRLISHFERGATDIKTISADISNQVCASCVNAAKCAADTEYTEGMESLAQMTVDNKVSVAGLPQFFTAVCIRPSNIIRRAGEISSKIGREMEQSRCENIARSIVSEQLKGVSGILSDMGGRAAQPLSFDRERENAIMTELNYALVDCADAFVSADGVTVLCRTQNCNRALIQKAVSRVMKQSFIAQTPDRTHAAGWSAVYLKRAPKYEAVFGTAGKSKQSACGDTHSVIKINNKLLAALVDGMGSGESAAKSSEAAVSLIESFYKAGFDSVSALDSVNRFLKLPDDESYSAADVCVIDLESAQADIYKIGSPATYIKTRDTVLKIQGSSLPIGIVNEMRPYTNVKKLKPGEVLIMITDGIADAFLADELAMFINSLDTFNPQAVAKSILERALSLYGQNAKDDMTVLTLRLFENKK